MIDERRWHLRDEAEIVFPVPVVLRVDAGIGMPLHIRRRWANFRLQQKTVLSRFLSIQELDSWQSVTKEVVEYHFFRHEKRMLLPRRSLDKDSSRKITAILLFPTDPTRAISWEIRSY